MDKDLSKFGGSLKFFYFLFWFIFIVSSISVSTVFYVHLFPAKSPNNYSSTNLDLITSLISLSLLLYVLLVFKKPKPKTVSKLKVVFFCLISVHIVYGLANLYFYQTPFPKLASFMLPLIFLCYIYSSKRAAIYYKRTEALKKFVETEEQANQIAHGLAFKSFVSLAVALSIVLLSWAFL
jgi:hypothetical protein